MKWGLIQNTKKNRLIIIVISLCIYGAALFTPALYFILTKHDLNTINTTLERWMGYEVLLEGWLGIFVGIFTWYANIFYILIIILFYLNKIKKSLLFGTGMVLIMATITTIKYYNLPTDESGYTTRTFGHFGMGAYLWVLSLLLLYIFIVLFWLSDSFKSNKTS